MVPKDVPRSPRGAQDRPKGAKEDPRMDQRKPKGIPKGAQEAQKAPRWRLRCSKFEEDDGSKTVKNKLFLKQTLISAGPW